MTQVETENLEIHPVTFPPQVLARISPELSLQRHLSLGIRPCLRKFEEFRNVHINQETLSRYSLPEDLLSKADNNILGSNVLKCGNTFVITSITGGIVEETLPVNTDDLGEEELLSLSEKRDEIKKYASVYPVVEVERGRVGAPTDEEMTISQKLHDCILHSGIIPKASLDVNCGMRVTGKDGNKSVLYPDEQEGNATLNQLQHNKKWSYVLYAKIIVFSRTGPVFDLCWNSLMFALGNTRLPRAFIDERVTDLTMTVRTRGRSATVKEAYDILCDAKKSVPLKIVEAKIGYASSYGLVDLDREAQINEDEDEPMEEPESVLLADLDTEAEESCIHSTISIIGDSKRNFSNVTIVGAGAKITPDVIKKAVLLSRQRSEHLSSLI